MVVLTHFIETLSTLLLYLFFILPRPNPESLYCIASQAQLISQTSTAHFKNSFYEFQRIVNLRNIVPNRIKLASSFVLLRRNTVFNQDNVCTNKRFCRECRGSNGYTVCSCKLFFISCNVFVSYLK